MDRHYFQNTGAYDSDMTMWGAENLELSIRVRTFMKISSRGNYWAFKEPEFKGKKQFIKAVKCRTYLGVENITFLAEIYAHAPWSVRTIQEHAVAVKSIMWGEGSFTGYHYLPENWVTFFVTFWKLPLLFQQVTCTKVNIALFLLPTCSFNTKLFILDFCIYFCWIQKITY